MRILIRMKNGSGYRTDREDKTRVSQIMREALKEIGIKGKFTLRSAAGKLNPNSTLKSVAGEDPPHVERVWKLERVEKKAAKRRRR